MQSNSNIECLIIACRELSIPYSFLDRNSNFVLVGKEKPLYFVNHFTPLNDESSARIAKDKEFSYNILKDHIRTPLTKGYLDPHVSAEFNHYLEFKDIKTIASDIANSFSLPCIVKRNAGSLGKNVFIANTKEEVVSRLTNIFDHNSKEYDYVALAQERVPIAMEYRVVTLDGKIKLIYEKNISKAKFKGNLSPLHWEDARAVLVEDETLQKKMQEFILPIFKQLDLRWSGLDVGMGMKGDFWLLEVNSAPGFGIFIRDNGKTKVIELYKEVLKSM